LINQKYILVGGGLAASCLAFEFIRRKIEFVWYISPQKPSASRAAYGILNPVHIRNAELSWNAKLFYSHALPFYEDIKTSTGVDFAQKKIIYHVLSSEEEAVLWRQQSELGILDGFTSGDVEFVDAPDLIQPFGCIKIHEALYVNVPKLIDAVLSLAAQQNIDLRNEHFEEQQLVCTENELIYNGSYYTGIVYCDGIHALENPFFKKLPFNPCKGEVLEVEIPELHINECWHKKIFLIPEKNRRFKAGSNYDWDHLDFIPSEKTISELKISLSNLLTSDFKIINTLAGVRPSMADRKPVVGSHPLYKNIYTINGFGSRGLMLSPYCTTSLIENLLYETPIMPEINVSRFKKRLRNLF
jgi:glycine oxidase